MLATGPFHKFTVVIVILRFTITGIALSLTIKDTDTDWVHPIMDIPIQDLEN